MINLQQSDWGSCLVLQANRSSSWQANKRLILIVAFLSVAVAGGFAMIGAWIILPFAGLEILGLSAALYSVNWRLSYRQVLWFEDGALRIETGFRKAERAYRLKLCDTSIHVHDKVHAGAVQDSPLDISLCSGANSIAIGEFLTREDGLQLLQVLRSLGLNTRGYSDSGDLKA